MSSIDAGFSHVGYAAPATCMPRAIDAISPALVTIAIWLSLLSSISIPGRDAPLTAGSLDTLALFKVSSRLMILLILGWAIVSRMRSSVTRRYLVAFLPWILYVGWAIASTLWSALPSVSLGQSAGQATLLLVGISVATIKPEQLPRMLAGMLLPVLLFIFVFGFGAVVLPDQMGLERTGDGGFIHPTSLGAAASLGAVLLTGILLCIKHRWLPLLAVVGYPACIVAMVAAQNRLSIALAVAVSTGLIIAQGRSHRLAFGAMLFAAMGVGYLFVDPGLVAVEGIVGSSIDFMERGQSTEELTSLSGRSEMWLAMWKSWQDSPLIGHGYFVCSAKGTLYVWFVELNHTAHNELLQVLVTTGLIGLAIYVVWWLQILRMWIRQTGRNAFSPVTTSILVWFLGWMTLTASSVGPIRPESLIFAVTIGLVFGHGLRDGTRRLGSSRIAQRVLPRSPRRGRRRDERRYEYRYEYRDERPGIQRLKLLLVHNYYQERGGEDESFEAEAAMLRSFGHEVITYTRHNDEIEKLSKLKVAIDTIWSRSTYNELSQLIEKESPDLMHCTNLFPLITTAAYSAARKHRVPVVQSLRNYRAMCVASNFFRNGSICEDCLGKPFAIKGVLRACYRGSRLGSTVVGLRNSLHHTFQTWHTKVDRFFTPTNFTREKYIEGGFPGNLIGVKPNFLAPDPGASDSTGEYGLFIGRLTAEKGLDTIIEAWNDPSINLPLKIVGDGALGGMIEEACSTNDRIQWEGRQPLSRVNEIIGNASFVLMPSIWYETFGRTIMESFSRGIPVIASRLGAMEELVDEGETGLLFEPGNARSLVNAVNKLTNDSELRSSMCVNARAEYLAKYTAQRNHDLLMSVYQEARNHCDARQSH